jgi:zinc transport system permease protein
MEILELLNYQFFRMALISAFLMSVTCGIVGTYIVSRRMVFISGGITHASFGGVGLGYFLGIPPLAGAGVFALAAALATEHLTRKKIIRNDSVIAIMWSLGMALGIIFIYLTPGYAPDLMSYLFGSIITTSRTDLWFMLALAIVVSSFFLIFFRPVLYISFDEEFARSRGIPVMLYNYILIVLVALAIVLSIRVAGIILVLSILTIPQNVANLFTKRFGKIMIYSVILGFLASLLGLVISYYLDIPSGATIIFTLVVIYLVARVVKVATFGSRKGSKDESEANRGESLGGPGAP